MKLDAGKVRARLAKQNGENGVDEDNLTVDETVVASTEEAAETDTSSQNQTEEVSAAEPETAEPETVHAPAPVQTMVKEQPPVLTSDVILADQQAIASRFQKEATALPENNMVRFVSGHHALEVGIEITQQSKDGPVRNSYNVKFKNGVYATDVPREIKQLRELAGKSNNLNEQEDLSQYANLQAVNAMRQKRRQNVVSGVVNASSGTDATDAQAMAMLDAMARQAAR